MLLSNENEDLWYLLKDFPSVPGDLRWLIGIAYSPFTAKFTKPEPRSFTRDLEAAISPKTTVLQINPSIDFRGSVGSAPGPKTGAGAPTQGGFFQDYFQDYSPPLIGRIIPIILSPKGTSDA